MSRPLYQARDTRLDRTVAIKVLPEHLAADPDLKQRFEGHLSVCRVALICLLRH